MLVMFDLFTHYLLESSNDDGNNGYDEKNITQTLQRGCCSYLVSKIRII